MTEKERPWPSCEIIKTANGFVVCEYWNDDADFLKRCHVFQSFYSASKFAQEKMEAPLFPGDSE